MNPLSNLAAQHECGVIDKLTNQRYSGGYIRWNPPKQRVNPHMPTNPILLSQDVLTDIVSKSMEVWEVRHDDGSVMYSGTRTQAERWMDKRKNVGELALVRGEK